MRLVDPWAPSQPLPNSKSVLDKKEGNQPAHLRCEALGENSAKHFDFSDADDKTSRLLKRGRITNFTLPWMLFVICHNLQKLSFWVYTKKILDPLMDLSTYGLT